MNQAAFLPDKITHFFQPDFNPALANMPQSELYQLVSDIKAKQEGTVRQLTQEQDKVMEVKS